MYALLQISINPCDTLPNMDKILYNCFDTREERRIAVAFLNF